MAFNIMGFVLGEAIARNDRITNPAAATQVGVIGGLFGFTPIGIVLTSTLAQRLAPPSAAPATNAVTAGALGQGAQATGRAGLGASTQAGNGGTPLPSPGSVVASAQPSGRVIITWEPVDRAVQYVITRTHKGKQFTSGATASVEFVDDLPPEAKPEHYSYRVAAVSGGGVVGDYSAPVSPAESDPQHAMG